MVGGNGANNVISAGVDSLHGILGGAVLKDNLITVSML